MIYRCVSVLLSSSGFTIAFTEFHESAGKWSFDLKNSDEYNAGSIKGVINDFFKKNKLQYKVALVSVHSELPGTIFYGPAVAASTGLPVITELNALDIELGGNGQYYPFVSIKLDIQNVSEELGKTICIAFLGILRWREEYNFLSSFTGASRSSIGGAIWLGQEG